MDIFEIVTFQVCKVSRRKNELLRLLPPFCMALWLRQSNSAMCAFVFFWQIVEAAVGIVGDFQTAQFSLFWLKTMKIGQGDNRGGRALTLKR